MENSLKCLYSLGYFFNKKKIKITKFIRKRDNYMALFKICEYSKSFINKKEVIQSFTSVAKSKKKNVKIRTNSSSCLLARKLKTEVDG